MIATNDDNTVAVMVETNSETDFVARDDNFLGFANKAEAALAAGETDAAKIGELKLEDGSTVEETRQALVQKIGENIQIRRAAKLEASAISAYVHGGKIGVLALNWR